MLGKDLQAVKLPTIPVPIPVLAVVWDGRLSLLSWRKLTSQLFIKSELFVLELGGLQQTADLLSPLHVCSFGVGFALLLLNHKELCVVAGKLLERNEEISKIQTELIVRRVE